MIESFFLLTKFSSWFRGLLVLITNCTLREYPESSNIYATWRCPKNMSFEKRLKIWIKGDQNTDVINTCQSIMRLLLKRNKVNWVCVLHLQPFLFSLFHCLIKDSYFHDHFVTLILFQATWKRFLLHLTCCLELNNTSFFYQSLIVVVAWLVISS